MVENRLKTADDVTWLDVDIGGIICEPGNACKRRTGDWRSQRPVVDKDNCIKCGMCWLHCPEGAVMLLEDGYFEPNLYSCKGCGICAQVCPKKAISLKEEEEI
jgi:pyruvate ferredoxin oxidoreductase delta subunit